MLLQLASEAGVKDFTERMFNGDKINTTENRPVLHVYVDQNQCEGFGFFFRGLTFAERFGTAQILLSLLMAKT